MLDYLYELISSKKNTKMACEHVVRYKKYYADCTMQLLNRPSMTNINIF